MKLTPWHYLEDCLNTYPVLKKCRKTIEKAFKIIERCYCNNGKLLVCGNGGSAADSEHIVGELMKGFLKARPIPPKDKRALYRKGTDCSGDIASCLQGALPAISLVSQISLTSAFTNDISHDMVFAQQVYGYGRKGDVLLAISTSGNATNVINAAKTARAFNISVVGLTGQNGGKLKSLCDVAICVPASKTYQIQELHIPVYHTLCAMLEEKFFPV